MTWRLIWRWTSRLKPADLPSSTPTIPKSIKSSSRTPLQSTIKCPWNMVRLVHTMAEAEVSPWHHLKMRKEVIKHREQKLKWLPDPYRHHISKKHWNCKVRVLCRHKIISLSRKMPSNLSYLHLVNKIHQNQMNNSFKVWISMVRWPWAQWLNKVTLFRTWPISTQPPTWPKLFPIWSKWMTKHSFRQNWTKMEIALLQAKKIKLKRKLITISKAWQTKWASWCLMVTKIT